ncbi:MAG: mammalian cell entry protein [Pseudomonadota bacterium]|nr:mammalian cell entry protein [Pseudomonadota bacterium]MDP1905874.1 mammalian cell entry protein [Pseudomonadota bacterium]MDP2351746.1 mammalian cell entry protein [Pseudomonadota bacterium]
MERAPISPAPPVPRAPLIKNLEFKIGLLLALTVLLIAAFFAYALYARGAFQVSNKLILTAEDVEGVSIGMPISYSGFPIGKVSRLHLLDDGQIQIELAIPREDARWLRESSVFTLEKALVGGAKIKAHTTNLQDPPLADGAVRPLYTGDSTKDIPVLIAKVKNILANVETMTAAGAPINQTLDHVEVMTGRMAGENGLIGGLMGSPEDARKVVKALDRADTLLASLNGVSLKVDGVLSKVDRRLFDQHGVMDQAQLAIVNVNAILGDARESLKKADAILANAQTASKDLTQITGNVAEATTDMGRLRLDIDDSLRKVNHLINEINKKWPFARDVEIKTP